MEEHSLERRGAQPNPIGSLGAERRAARVADPNRDAPVFEPVVRVEPDLEGHRLAFREAVADGAVSGDRPHLVHAVATRPVPVAVHHALRRRAHEPPVVGPHDLAGGPDSTQRPCSSRIARSQTFSTAAGSCETNTIVPPLRL